MLQLLNVEYLDVMLQICNNSEIESVMIILIID
jgi:hypothetical protein